jgi:hypothetical protein
VVADSAGGGRLSRHPGRRAQARRRPGMDAGGDVFDRRPRRVVRQPGLAAARPADRGSARPRRSERAQVSRARSGDPAADHECRPIGVRPRSISRATRSRSRAAQADHAAISSLAPIPGRRPNRFRSCTCAAVSTPPSSGSSHAHDRSARRQRQRAIAPGRSACMDRDAAQAGHEIGVIVEPSATGAGRARWGAGRRTRADRRAGWPGARGLAGCSVVSVRAQRGGRTPGASRAHPRRAPQRATARHLPRPTRAVGPEMPHHAAQTAAGMQ